MQMTIADGVAEITDAKLSAPGLRAALHGRTSLAHQTLAAKASVEYGAAAPGAGPAIVLDITGPWGNPTVVRPSRRRLRRLLRMRELG